jgi:hypothetical protein
MKQTLLFLFLLFLGSTLFAQDIRFNFHTSELYATYDFLLKICDNYPDNELKTLFNASAYNTEDNQKQVSDFEQLRLDYAYAFTQYPATLKAGLMSRDILERNLAISDNIDQFRSRSAGIITNEDLLAMTSILKNFVPVYHALVFEPNKKAFTVQQQNLLKYVDDKSFSSYFKTGLIFYGTTWDKELPIELNLLLSLDKGNLGARAFNNVAICEASLDLTDNVGFFSVAMHELYHIIYDSQPLETKKSIQRWFNGTNSPNSQYALLLINEVLATALGNGYIIEKETGKADQQEWYANKYISEMAKAIYPVVMEYINAKKPMDEAFIKAYVQIYDKQFSHWAKELDHLLTYRYIVADDYKDWQYFRKKYRYHSYSRYGAPITPAEVEKAKESPVTKVFIVSQEHKKTLDILQQSFPELANSKFNYKKEFIETVNLDNHTRLFIINRYQSTVEQLMTKYFIDNTIK